VQRSRRSKGCNKGCKKGLQKEENPARAGFSNRTSEEDQSQDLKLTAWFCSLGAAPPAQAQTCDRCFCRTASRAIGAGRSLRLKSRSFTTPCYVAPSRLNGLLEDGICPAPGITRESTPPSLAGAAFSNTHHPKGRASFQLESRLVSDSVRLPGTASWPDSCRTRVSPLSQRRLTLTPTPARVFSAFRFEEALSPVSFASFNRGNQSTRLTPADQ
jgi:hypothetical protein